jgi:uncharacterized protein (DUF1697 family)
VTRYVAFLRGINLGKRQIRMAELKACLEALGLDDVKTLLTSGNVSFRTNDAEGLGKRLETAIEARFGFPVGVVLRSDAELRAMIAAQPFGSVASGADVKLYVTLLDAPLAPGIDLAGEPDDYDVVRADPREIYVIAHKKPNGRYGEGLDKLSRQMDKSALATTRNWNTILKAIG